MLGHFELERMDSLRTGPYIELKQIAVLLQPRELPSTPVLLDIRSLRVAQTVDLRTTQTARGCRAATRISMPNPIPASRANYYSETPNAYTSECLDKGSRALAYSTLFQWDEASTPGAHEKNMVAVNCDDGRGQVCQRDTASPDIHKVSKHST